MIYNIYCRTCILQWDAAPKTRYPEADTPKMYEIPNKMEKMLSLTSLYNFIIVVIVVVVIITVFFFVYFILDYSLLFLHQNHKISLHCLFECHKLLHEYYFIGAVFLTKNNQSGGCAAVVGSSSARSLYLTPVYWE